MARATDRAGRWFHHRTALTWGYAEEFAISRYVVDATVLPIFEGVKPILELKVIARNLLAFDRLSPSA